MIHSYLVWFLWWLRHGAIGPIEATLLNSEFTHFNLVIRPSKVQQLALPLCTFSQSLADPAVPGFLANAVLQLCSRAEHPETSFFRSSFYSYITRDRAQAGTRLLGVVFFLLTVLWWGETYCAPNSLELESRLCQLGQDLTTVPARE